MPDTDQITLTLRDDQIEQLEQLAGDDDPRYTSKSEAARHLVDRADKVDELERERDRLENANKVIVDRYEETQMKVADTDDDTTIIGRLSWLLRG